ELGGPVLAGRHRLVIVTGNAGDGKTAFIQKVEMDACRAGAVELQHSLNGRRLAYAGREIVTLYDGSQDEAERASDDLLMEFLMPFRAGEPDDRTIRLAAINEGRLRDFLIGHRNQYPNLAADVIAMLDSAQTPISNSGITVVNLNLRSVTAAERESIFSRQVEKIVGGPFWGPCEECAYRGRCPIKHNVDTFRDSASGPAVTERLRTLVDLVRLRRRRHLTVRDVRSLIAHILFRDRACEEIPELLASDDPFAVVDVAYFQGPGGMGVPDGSTLERGAELLAEIDVALVANPDDDRAIATGDGPRRMSFVDRDSDYLAELLRIARNRAGTGYESDIPLARRTHEALRRQSYFERADDGWRSMLPYQRLSEFKRALQPANEGSRAQLRAQLIKALSIREGMRDSKQAEVALWLATTDPPMPDYGCYRRYAIEQFELRVALAETPYVESEPDQLELVHLPSLAALSINIDLLEVLEHLGEGYMPSLDERSGFLVNLALFRHRLLAEPTTELMLQAENGLLRIAPGALPGSVALSEVHG
ncbi:MAG: hypothetical protein ACR2PL_10735, partial [Dehalococcoidia bacterium]